MYINFQGHFCIAIFDRIDFCQFNVLGFLRCVSRFQNLPNELLHILFIEWTLPR